MKKFIFLILVILVVVSFPVFSEVSVDLGLSALNNAVYQVSRPVGGMVGLGFTLFDNIAIVQVTGGFFVPPLSEAYSDPAGVLSAGVLFSPVKYVYMGFRSGLITPPDDYSDWLSYGAMVLRVQKQGKGLHFFAESEISMTAFFNRFTMGMNFTL